MGTDLVVHSHAAAARHGRLVLRHFGDHGFGRDQEAGDGGGVLQRRAHHLRRIDDALVEHVDVFLGLRVEAESLRLVLEDLVDDDRAFDTGILGDLAQRRFDGLEHDVDAGLDVGIAVGQLTDRLLGAKESDAAARHDAFLDRGAGGIERVFNAILLLLDFDFGRTADADDGNAARELGQPLLQLLAVVVRSGLLDLRLYLIDAGLDVLLLAGAVDDRGLFLLDHDLLGAAEHRRRHAFELDAEIFGNELAAGEDGDVFQHRLAAIAEARRLHGRDLQPAAQLVDHQGRQRFALDILGDDHQRTARLHDAFQQRQHRLQAG